MDQKYAAVLRSFPSYAEAAEDICMRSAGDRFSQLTAQVTAPVLFTYVWHVLVQAERMGLKRLYFLARDGYVMLEIAQEIARVCPVSLELRYLYCSGAAMRLPSCSRIEDEEAMRLMLQRGSRPTLQHIMNRADLNRGERSAVCQELGFQAEEVQRSLSVKEYDAMIGILRRSDSFRRMVKLHAKAAYDAAFGYLVQEGFTDGKAFGIVDTGWTGAVQRSLRLLSEQIPSITGFYFGMTERKRAADGVFSTWYFSAEDAAKRARFSESLFSAMCAAPQGMTTGYREENGRYVPVMREYLEDGALSEAIHTQLSVCREFAAICAPKVQYDTFDAARMRRLTEKLLTGLMYRPTAEEATLFGTLPCRDSAGILIRNDAETLLREHAFLMRSLRNLRGKEPSEALLWKYGTLALSRLKPKPVYRAAMRRWDEVQCRIGKFKEN